MIDDLNNHDAIVQLSNVQLKKLKEDEPVMKLFHNLNSRSNFSLI